MTTTAGFSLRTSAIKNGITWRKSANFAAQEIINRSSPIYTFRSSSAIDITVNLDLFAHDSGSWNAQKIAKLQKALTAITFPQQSGTMPPPICYVTWGSGIVFSHYACLLTNVSCGSGQEGTYDKQGDSFTGTASLSFVGIELMAQDLSDFAGDAMTTYENLSFESSSGGTGGPTVISGGESSNGSFA